MVRNVNKSQKNSFLRKKQTKKLEINLTDQHLQ